MQIELAYGKTGLTVDFPDAANVTVIQSQRVDGLSNPIKAISQALHHPFASPPLPSLVKPTDVVAIVFSDITRPTPNHLLIPAIRAALPQVPDAQIILFNATGTHRANTDAELRAMLGDEVVTRYRIVQHDADHLASHRSVGYTRSGNEILLLAEYLDCDVHILTGFIEPHFFAGFSGGGKAVMPGLAALPTIQRNHGAAHLDHPSACWGVTEGNPLWEEVFEAGLLSRPDFLVNVTLNSQKEITGIFAGEYARAHQAGCDFVRETAMVPVPALFDIVIGSNSGYPLDLNLYQSVKGMSAAAQVVKPGGSIIIAADCWDGIPDHGEYGRLLREASNPHDLLAMIRTPGFCCQDMWQAQIHALISLKAELYFFSDHLTEAQIRGALLSPCANIAETVTHLLARYGPEASICVLPEGPLAVPYVASPVSASAPASDG